MLLEVAIFLGGDQVQEFDLSGIRAVWAWFGPLTQVDFTPHGVPEGGKKQKKLLGYDTYIF